ncbi:MAG: ABC transporter substrate-binding protein [Cyanobacteria bacterium P01_F01_bin.53]
MPLSFEPANFKRPRSRWPKANEPFALGLIVGCLLGLSACSQPLPAPIDATDNAKSGSTSDPKTVTILGQFSGKQQEHFEKTLVPFEEEHGIDVIYEATDNFSTLLNMRITSFAEPDLVVLPQPGLMADLAREGLLVPLTEVIDTKALRQSYPDAWLDLGRVDDVPYGLWYRVSVKSLVWYRPTAFEDKGYDIPRTWAEMMALSDRIVADGGTPWCIGLESGAASGWPGTDWIEDIMLRTAGPEAYRQWISHELPFNSPIVLNAFQEFGKILRNPKYVSGGTAKAIATPYGDSISGIFSNPPECYLHRQANFISAFLPEDKSPRVDYDAFLLPGMSEQFGSPLLVAGDAVAMFHKTPEAEKLMQYLASPEPHIIGAQLGGFISPQQQVPLEEYPDLVSQNVAQILADADVIRFDASDMMPGFVGSDAFWDGMMDFAAGKSAEDITKEIDRNWPK